MKVWRPLSQKKSKPIFLERVKDERWNRIRNIWKFGKPTVNVHFSSQTEKGDEIRIPLSKHKRMRYMTHASLRSRSLPRHRDFYMFMKWYFSFHQNIKAS